MTSRVKPIAIVAGGLLAVAFIARFIYASVTRGEAAAKAAEFQRQTAEMAKQPEALVECPQSSATPAGFKCKVTSRTAKSEIKVCWDLMVECKSGKPASAHACRWVDPLATASYFIQTKDVKDFAECGEVTGLSAANITVEQPQ